MQNWAVLFVLTNASTDSMFRTLPATIIRNIKTAVTATGECHEWDIQCIYFNYIYQTSQNIYCKLSC